MLMPVSFVGESCSSRGRRSMSRADAFVSRGSTVAVRQRWASREPDVQGRAVAEGAEDRDCSAERLDPVFQADDARPSAGVGAPDAVVADREGEGAVVALY